MKYDKYSNYMLELAQKQNQHELDKARKKLSLLEQEDQEIQDEIKERLKIQINETIKKVQQAGDKSYV